LVYGGLVIFFQETINYIEHYGLERKKDENGVYESVNIMHSWNSSRRYSNYILFKLQRHSDHHANAYKPYQILNTFSDSPTLTGGYSLAVITSLVPSVFKTIYDPIVIAARKEMSLSSEQKAHLEKLNYLYLTAVGTILGGLTLMIG